MTLAFRRPRRANPANWCSGCGEDFSSVRAFEAHRTGDHSLNWPEHENGRRCVDQDELEAIGLERDARGRWCLTADVERIRAHRTAA